MNTLIRPTKRKRISPKVSDINGITMKMLKNSPSFKDIFNEFYEIIKDKTILIYNADFDIRMIKQTAFQDEIEVVDKKIEYQCVMKEYSSFIGQWNDYFNDYKWQKLPGAEHTAINDCESVLKLLHKMSKSEIN